WNLSESEALELQQTLAKKVIKDDTLSSVKLVAGVDVAYDDKSQKLFAAVVVLNADSLDIVDTSIAEDNSQFPYIPGLFSFRELPSVIKALKQLKATPDLIVCDGQGTAHPRRFGLACHLGVLFDIPTIGCGKTRFIGTHEEPGIKRGDYAPLLDNEEIIGNALRTQDNIKPVYVSIGHKICLQTACEWVLKLSKHYRLPETTRQADQAVRRALVNYHLPK
ncbi:MAG TPA: deoxyribonuclease V, partial [Clostridia bacterium]